MSDLFGDDDHDEDEVKSVISDHARHHNIFSSVDYMNGKSGTRTDSEDEDFVLFRGTDETENNKTKHSCVSSSSSSSVSPSSVPKKKSKNKKKDHPRRTRDELTTEFDLDEYDDGDNMNRHAHKLQRSKKLRRNEDHLDEIEEAMEMGMNDLPEEDEYESVPIVELDWTPGIKREQEYEEKMFIEAKLNQVGLKPERYDKNFNFFSFAVETKSQETSFPLFKGIFAFFDKAEETSDYVDLCMQVQDYYNEYIRPVSSVGNKCWPVQKIWEYFHITCPSIKHNLEFELRCMNRLYDTISNCVLKRNKNTGKTDQIDTKCIKLKFQIMEIRGKLMREVYNMRFNKISEESKQQQQHH